VADDGAKLQRAMAGTLEALRRAMLQTLDADGARWEGSLAKSIRGPLFLGPGKSVDADLATRSGRLRRSFGNALSGTEQLEGMTSQKYTSSPYALIHELGGIIRAKTARMLAIPLPPAMTASGVPRLPGPRAYGRGLFMLRIRGKYFLARKQPQSKAQQQSQALSSLARGHGARTRKRPKRKLELLYILKDRVIITPRLGMRKFHEQDTAVRISDFGRFATLQLQAVAARAAG
jgi:hypothetical protein